MLFALGSPDTPFAPPSLPTVTEAQLFDVERTVIESIAAHESAVIVGRGAGHVLGGSATVLRVFLHAPKAVRITTAMDEYGLDDRVAAEQILRDSDRARSKFVRSLTGRDWCDATLYDLTLDTHVSGFDRAVDLIVRMASGLPGQQVTNLTPPRDRER
jgi:cytidylate kinase